MISLSAGAADLVVIHLKNGDRLTGEIASESASEVTIATKAFGKLAIPAAEIQRREHLTAEQAKAILSPSASTNAVAAVPATATQNPAALPKTNAPATVASAPAPKPEVKPAPAQSKGPKLWNAEVQLGMNLRYSATDSQEYLLMAKATYAPKPFRHILDYNFTYGRTEGILSADRMLGSEKTEYDLNNRWYLFNAAGAGYDHIRKISLQVEDSPGVGYLTVTNSMLILKSELGLTYQKQFRIDDIDQTTYSARIGEIFTWHVWDKLIAEGRAEFFPNMEHFGEYRVRLESTLRYPLTKTLSLNLILIDLYDTLPAAGVRNNDLQIRSTLGVKF